MTRFENHKYTIQQAFKECFYIVPDYQREYVWTEKQVYQLLEDIHEEIYNGSSEYFIGNILVSPRKDANDHVDIIDGQQRLTTIFLILCALRALFKTEQSDLIKKLTIDTYADSKGDTRTNLKLDPQYENVAEVIEKIVQDNCGPQTARASVRWSSGTRIYGSIKRILDAYECIYRFLEERYDDEVKLKEYWGYLANNVVFIQISTDVSSALKIFETINERGIGLNPMDLLKNMLFTQVQPEDFSKLKNEWKRVTNPLEENKKKPLRFLRYFLMANYKIKNNRNESIIREDEIYDWFLKEENAELTNYREKPFEFVRQIIRNVELYIYFSNGYGNDRKPNPAIASLETLTGGAFSLHYILLLAASSLPKSLFDQFVTQIESYLFYHIFTKTPSKYLERNFSTWADEIREIARVKRHEEQRDKLNTFVDRYFSEDMKNKDPELEYALKRLTLYSMQKYRIRYLLARLTQHVEMARKGLQDRDNLGNYFGLEIEHVLPQNPKDDLRNAWQKQSPEHDYDEMKNRLGNLTLLEKPDNIILGNDFYKKKVSKYEESGNYLTRSLSKLENIGQNSSVSRINEKLLSFDKWDASDIEKRQSLLIELSKEIWKTTKITA